MADSSSGEDHRTDDRLEYKPGDKLDDKLDEILDDKFDNISNDDNDDDDNPMSEFEPVIASLNLEYLPYFASALRRSNQQTIGAEKPSNSGPNPVPLDCTVLFPPLFGSYHIIYPLKFTDGTQWVLKVPSSGYPGQWSDISARSLRCEALTMRLLKRSTTIPIPEVYSFDASLDNQLNCPFMLMEYIPGLPLYKVWFNEAATPAFLEQCRKRALEDIAEAMVQLNRFAYSQGGSLSFDKEGNVEGISSMQFVDQADVPVLTFEDIEKGIQCEIGPFGDAKTQLLYPVNSRQPLGSKTCRRTLMGNIDEGTYKLLRLFFDWIPAQLYDNNLGFVLAHPDFDIQNMIVTEEGKLCGLIDWDGVIATPRCVGCESYPSWLTRDWDPVMYRYDPEGPNPIENSPEELAYYRSIYRQNIQCALVKHKATLMSRSLDENLSSIFKRDCAISITHNSLIMDNLVIAANNSAMTVEIVMFIVERIQQDTATQWPSIAPDTIKTWPEENELKATHDHQTNNIVIEGLDKSFDKEKSSHDASSPSSSSSEAALSDTTVERDSDQIGKEHSGVQAQYFGMPEHCCSPQLPAKPSNATDANQTPSLNSDTEVIQLEMEKVTEDEGSLTILTVHMICTMLCGLVQTAKSAWSRIPNQKASSLVPAPRLSQDGALVDICDTSPPELDEDTAQDSVKCDAAHRYLDEQNLVISKLSHENIKEETLPPGSVKSATGFNFFDICETLANGELDKERMRRLKEGFQALVENPDLPYEVCLMEENGM